MARLYCYQHHGQLPGGAVFNGQVAEFSCFGTFNCDMPPRCFIYVRLRKALKYYNYWQFEVLNDVAAATLCGLSPLSRLRLLKSWTVLDESELMCYSGVKRPLLWAGQAEWKRQEVPLLTTTAHDCQLVCVTWPELCGKEHENGRSWPGNSSAINGLHCLLICIFRYRELHCSSATFDVV